jgi:hypothetical protein
LYRFLGLNFCPASAWVRSGYGHGTIAGMLDTGVWLESPSFDERGMLCGGPACARAGSASTSPIATGSSRQTIAYRRLRRTGRDRWGRAREARERETDWIRSGGEKKLRKGKMDNSYPKYMKRRIEKRENTSNGSIIKLHMSRVSILQSQC